MNDNLCVFGDGDAQLKLFNDVKQYFIHDTAIIRMGSQSQGKFQMEIVEAQLPLLQIIVVKKYVPNLEFWGSPQYHVQIKNNKTNNTYNQRGTMAHMMYDLLTQRQLKVRQK